MSDEIVTSKIELLEEQIANIERSGFYTEQEINKLTYPLVIELSTLRLALPYKKASLNLNDFTSKCIEIEVNNPEIINQNNSEE